MPQKKTRAGKDRDEAFSGGRGGAFGAHRHGRPLADGKYIRRPSSALPPRLPGRTHHHTSDFKAADKDIYPLHPLDLVQLSLNSTHLSATRLPQLPATTYTALHTSLQQLVHTSGRYHTQRPAFPASSTKHTHSQCLPSAHRNCRPAPARRRVGRCPRCPREGRRCRRSASPPEPQPPPHLSSSNTTPLASTFGLTHSTSSLSAKPPSAMTRARALRAGPRRPTR